MYQFAIFNLLLTFLTFRTCWSDEKSRYKAFQRCYDLFDIKHGNYCESKSYSPGKCCVLENNDKATLYCLPRFIIAGTQKGGTSELEALLTQHPRIQHPPTAEEFMEIHFFDKHHMHAPCKGMDYVVRLPVGAEVHSTKLKDKTVFTTINDIPITLDKTPSYMRQEVYLRHIHAMLPDVKLLITLRHPTARAFSGFRYICFFCRGYYKKIIAVKNKSKSAYINTTYTRFTPDFSFATYKKLMSCDEEDFHNFIKRDQTREVDEDPNFNFSQVTPSTSVNHISIFALDQLAYGYYDIQLLNILKYFPPIQVLVVFQEEWMGHLPDVLSQIEDFIGLEHFNYTIPSTVVNLNKVRSVIRPDDKFLLDNFYTPHIARLRHLLEIHFNRRLPISWTHS